MKYFLTVTIAIAVFVLGYIFSDKLFENKKKSFNKKQKIIFTAVVGTFFLVAAILFPLLIPEEEMSVFEMLRTLVLIYILLFTAVIDLKTMLIPNKFLLILLEAGVVDFIAEAIVDFDTFKFDIIRSLIGCAVCFVIFLLGRLISRKGMGMGDIKLATLMGFFIGIDKVLGVMLWVMILAALTGVVLVIAKRVKLKSKLPMAPFFFIGTIVSYIMYIISIIQEVTI